MMEQWLTVLWEKTKAADTEILLWAALGLAALWVVLKLVRAVAGFCLHLVWIVAVLLVVIWAIAFFAG